MYSWVKTNELLWDILILSSLESLRTKIPGVEKERYRYGRGG